MMVNLVQLAKQESERLFLVIQQLQFLARRNPSIAPDHYGSYRLRSLPPSSVA